MDFNAQNQCPDFFSSSLSKSGITGFPIPIICWYAGCIDIWLVDDIPKVSSRHWLTNAVKVTSKSICLDTKLYRERSHPYLRSLALLKKSKLSQLFSSRIFRLSSG